MSGPAPEGTVVPAADEERYPFAQDLDGTWHRRPHGDTWTTSPGDQPNCRTACGQAIHSARVSEYQPEPDPSTGATLCQCVTAPPAATPPRPLTAPDVVAGLLADVAERDERLADVSAQLAEAKGNLARCAEEATAPVLYQAYVSGLHVTALRAGSHRDAVIASTPPYEQLGMEQQAGWNGVVVKTLQIARAWDWSAQVSQLRAELATCRERNAAIAVQSDQYRDQRDDAREQLHEIRDRLGNLAAGLDLSAAASRPSKKSEIESGCAQAVREIAASITVPDEGDDGSPAPKPVVIVFDINEGIQGWFHELANEVYAMSGETVVITEIDAEMSDVMIAVATRPVSVDEAIAIWHGDDEEPA